MTLPAAASPPVGTAQRIRTRAIWAVAFFAASVPPAIVAFGMAAGGGTPSAVAGPMAFGFWLIGLLMAVWAAFPTLRHWDSLPGPTRWLGALPLLSVSLFLSVVVVTAAFI